ncbi:glycosyltransferase family 4 protein [Halobacteriovorax sp. GB3]|uniref:glycosyltransferase family 4 protein n=1 Tax=Halobacteriovorax sp. GB3 TaxID=2719615 RepID=UPI002361B9DE|nr:glycosyltransferase family 4 protein [Halobacteriovorax sp. GB3]MDD0852525.1 glycosyltransferase family 4 protein [Halobacteriovorax sp. GB3]
MKKKVLLVSQHFWPENFRFNDLVNGLDRERIDLVVLTGKPNYPLGIFDEGYSFLRPLKETYKDITIYRSPLIARGTSKIQLALNYISFPFFASFFSFFLHLKYRFHLTFVTQTSPIFMAIPALVLKIFFRVPSVLWITDLWPESLVATKTINNKKILSVVDVAVRVIYRLSDLILVSCKGFEKSVRKRHDQANIEYFPYWAEDFYSSLLPSDEKVNTEAKSLYDPNIFTLMFAGNIGVAQGLETLVLAIKKVEHLNIRLLLLGDGRNRETLEQFVKDNELEDKITFLGSRPGKEMPSFFSIADVMYLGLRNDETFKITVPSKIQSYLACAKPILASIEGETEELINLAQCGLVSKFDDVEHLANNIQKFISLTKEQRNEMGLNGHSYYSRFFKRDLQMKKITNILYNFGERNEVETCNNRRN